MKCPGCGNEVREGARFCTKCGKPISQEMNLSDSSFNKEESGHSLPEENRESNSAEKQPFVWQEKYTYIAIALAVVLAAVVGFAVKAGRSAEDRREAAGMDDSADEYADSDREAQADETDENAGTGGEESIAENEEMQNDEYEQAQEEDSEEPEIYDETGIHAYELIVDDVSWTEAYENCLRMGGHLVRINSDEEYDAILRQIQEEDKGNIKFWIGGYRDDREEYRWVYNEDYGEKDDILMGDIIIDSDPMYAGYWLDGEPSFFDETTETLENRMNMFYMKSLDRWVWNDVPDDILEIAEFYAGTIGYICEYE